MYRRVAAMTMCSVLHIRSESDCVITAVRGLQACARRSCGGESEQLRRVKRKQRAARCAELVLRTRSDLYTQPVSPHRFIILFVCNDRNGRDQMWGCISCRRPQALPVGELNLRHEQEARRAF